MKPGQISFDRTTWVEIPAHSDFPLQNLPFGIFSTPSKLQKRVGIAIGEFVVDLSVLNFLNFFDDIDIPGQVFLSDSLNPFMALGKQTTRAIRMRVADVLDITHPTAKSLAVHFLHPMDKVQMHIPVQISNYTDFYSSKEHATNVGSMFRDPNNALLPNWLHLPVGYHGRPSSIVVSGTPLHRPMGQTMADGAEAPSFGPSRLVDFELEMAFVIGQSTSLGDRVSVDEAESYMFGMLLFNDWSARDIQKWEYVPLGPFLAKNFGSTVSPWIVTMDALEPFRVQGPAPEVEQLPYLQQQGAHNFDIHLEVAIQPDGQAPTKVSTSNFKYMYWSMAQQLAHHTVNGCNICIGDLYASGTISGPTPDSYGSMLELTWRGANPITLANGETRKFINDGDNVIVSGWAEKDGIRIGFGTAEGVILPAKP